MVDTNEVTIVTASSVSAASASSTSKCTKKKRRDDDRRVLGRGCGNNAICAAIVTIAALVAIAAVGSGMSGVDAFSTPRPPLSSLGSLSLSGHLHGMSFRGISTSGSFDVDLSVVRADNDCRGLVSSALSLYINRGSHEDDHPEFMPNSLNNNRNNKKKKEEESTSREVIFYNDLEDFDIGSIHTTSSSSSSSNINMDSMSFSLDTIKGNGDESQNTPNNKLPFPISPFISSNKAGRIIPNIIAKVPKGDIIPKNEVVSKGLPKITNMKINTISTTITQNPALSSNYFSTCDNGTFAMDIASSAFATLAPPPIRPKNLPKIGNVNETTSNTLDPSTSETTYFDIDTSTSTKKENSDNNNNNGMPSFVVNNNDDIKRGWTPNNKKKWSTNGFKAVNYLESLNNNAKNGIRGGSSNSNSGVSADNNGAVSGGASTSSSNFGSSTSLNNSLNPNNNGMNNTIFFHEGDLFDDPLNDNNDRNNKNNNNNKNPLSSLRETQALRRQSKLQSIQEAHRRANRRTNPANVIEARLEKERKERRGREEERLQKLYQEKRERIELLEKSFDLSGSSNEDDDDDDGGKGLEEGHHGEHVELAQKEEEAVNTNDITEIPKSSTTTKTRRDSDAKRGIPILDPFLDSPHRARGPLLIGGTLTLAYSDLTPFQKRSIEIAIENHEEHCTRMDVMTRNPSNSNQLKDGHVDDDDDDDDYDILCPIVGEEGGGIEAAPIIAIIDEYTSNITNAAAGIDKSNSNKKRYATLASLQIVESSSQSSSPDSSKVVKLMGVGRAYLRDYFSSTEIGLTREEKELATLWRLMEPHTRGTDDKYYDQDDVMEDDVLLEEEEEEEEDDEARDDLPVLMAEFDLLLDDSSVTSLKRSISKHDKDVSNEKSSSIHSIANLYRIANKVYRIHEERIHLLNMKTSSEVELARSTDSETFKNKDTGHDDDDDDDVDDDDDDEIEEYEDHDGLGLIGGGGGGEGGQYSPLHQNSIKKLDEAPSTRRRRRSGDNDSPPRMKRPSKQQPTEETLLTIPQLTRDLLSHLHPYYSPSYREREEYEAEVASFAALRSLVDYASPLELAMALMTPSAMERLEMIYDIMRRNVEEEEEEEISKGNGFLMDDNE